MDLFIAYMRIRFNRNHFIANERERKRTYEKMSFKVEIEKHIGKKNRESILIIDCVSNQNYLHLTFFNSSVIDIYR